ncbi:MAG: hypothetical protein IJC16_08150 [Rikenellaceae bacterium]|nr:hypothetical protein [Rikenellaceae bacterium]
MLSAASVFGLLFRQVRPPVILRVFGESDRMSGQPGSRIIASAIALIVFGLPIVFGANRPVMKKAASRGTAFFGCDSCRTAVI